MHETIIVNLNILRGMQASITHLVIAFSHVLLNLPKVLSTYLRLYASLTDFIQLVYLSERMDWLCFVSANFITLKKDHPRQVQLLYF